jgi:chromosome segregation protein
MRLTRLILGRYGHLDDVELTFPADQGLHIVTGANEAGKSTALAAIGDCLFGFPHRTPFAFLHATRDLRIGATLLAADGRENTFFRRKGRKEHLFDGQDRPLPESAIAAFLSGATRERFDRVFGLNGIELRRGGDSILKGEGEVGEQIVSAHTGLHGFRDLVASLDGDAGRLFGDRRGRREFHEATDRFRQARERIAERKIEPADYIKKQDELSKLNQTRAGNAIKAQVLHAERSKLDRIRRTTPARLALATAVASRTELGTVPDLPADAATRLQDAVGRRDQAIHDLTREQDRAAGLDAELQQLPATSPILAQADAIDVLAAHRQRIAGAERDRDDQRLLAAQCEATITGEGRRLGLALDAAALVALIPTALDQEKVNQALRRHERLLGQRTTAADDLTTSEAKLSDAQAALEALPEAEPFAELRAAIEAVQAEGRLESDLSEAEAAHRSATYERNRALASLPLWDGGADALAAAPVPLEAIIQRHADAWKAGQDAVRAAAGRLAEHDRALREFAAEARADEADGDLPTNEVIQAARTRRDRAWTLIRRQYVDGGAPPSAVERSDMAAGDDLPAAFDGLLRSADLLSDRRAAERERVVAVEQRKRDQLRRHALRDGDAAEHAAAVSVFEESLAAWRGLWQPTGIDPAEPAAMREWLQRRGAVLAEHKRVQDAERRVAALRQRHRNAFATLATLLPREAEQAGGNLSALLGVADRLCRQRERQAERLTKARDVLDLARADRRKAELGLGRIDKNITDWRTDWDIAVPLLSLPAGAPAELGPAALGLWNEIDQVSRRRRDALNRIEEMTATIDRFTADAAAVAGRVAPDLADVPPHDAVVELAARLAGSRQAARRRADLEAELAQLRTAIRQHAQERDAAEHLLVGLRVAAGAADDAALNEAIVRSAKHRTLSDQIAGREVELHGQDDGKVLAELAAEAEDVDFDVLPARIAGIETGLGAINAEELANQARITELKAALAAMEQGHDAAGAAQDMETALADIDDVAGRYVTARMAQVLLRAGIERFCRQQQDPLLGRAGQIFARLTEGRYDRLGVDEHDGKMLIKACRPDGTECQTDRLSEGTLDQLYLALRLAAIESYARTTEPLPFIADDLLVNFDDRRAQAAIRVLADFGKVTQVILFTHHGHIAAMAEAGAASVHPLKGSVAAV